MIVAYNEVYLRKLMPPWRSRRSTVSGVSPPVRRFVALAINSDILAICSRVTGLAFLVQPSSLGRRSFSVKYQHQTRIKENNQFNICAYRRSTPQSSCWLSRCPCRRRRWLVPLPPRDWMPLSSRWMYSLGWQILIRSDETAFRWQASSRRVSH